MRTTEPDDQMSDTEIQDNVGGGCHCSTTIRSPVIFGVLYCLYPREVIMYQTIIPFGLAIARLAA